MQQSSATPDGVLLVDKAAGMTSHDVVALVRRRLQIRKVGHCGTLDVRAGGAPHRREDLVRHPRPADDGQRGRGVDDGPDAELVVDGSLVLGISFGERAPNGASRTSASDVGE